MTLTSATQTTTWSAVLLGLWGFANCFFGYRWFKFVVTLLGIFVGAVGGFAGASLLFPGTLWLPWAGLGIGALLGGLLAFEMVRFAQFLFGFSLGFVLTLWLAQMAGETLIKLGVIVVGPVLLGAVVVGLIFGVLGTLFLRLQIIVSTAWSGAFWVALASAFFVYGLEPTHYLEQPGSLTALLDQHPWVLVHTAVLGVIGFFVQLSASGKPDKPEKAKK